MISLFADRCARRALSALGPLIVLLMPAVAPAQSTDGAGAPPRGEIAVLHELLNVYRTSVGCTSLRWHEPAARVAEAHSRDMERRDYLDHVSPEGTDPGRRLLAGGVTWHGLVAENIALTPAGASSVAELWLDSPPHRENIERCDFTHHGIGRHADLWTQVLIQNPGPGP